MARQVGLEPTTLWLTGDPVLRLESGPIGAALPALNEAGLVMLGSADMPSDHIIALLIAERDKLSRAIEALQGPVKRRGRPPKDPLAVSAPPPPAKKGRRTFTAEQRAAQAARMKAFWAKRRKAAK
jgi:hypothetical protein